jgi:phage terminase large subunit GpA-like protein
MSLFHTTEPDGHAEFFEQITAEKQVVKKGVIVWVTVRKQNHWLDCMGLAAMAARAAGVRVVNTTATPVTPKPPQRSLPGGRSVAPAKPRSRY